MNKSSNQIAKKIDFSIWKQLLQFAKPFRKTIFFLALSMMCVAGVDVLMPLLTRYIIDHFITPKDYSGIRQFAVIYAFVIVFQSFNIFYFIWLAGKVETGVSYAIRKAGFQRLQELSFSFFDKTAVGWLMTRMTSDTRKLSEVIAWGVVDLVWGGTLMSGIAIVMFIVHWKLALVTLSVMPFLFWVSRKFQIKILSAFRIVRKTNSKITASFNDGIMGATTTKTLVREEANFAEFLGLTGKMYRASFRASVQSALFLPIVLFGSWIGSALAIWLGGSGVIAGTITYGTLVLFISYADFFFIPIREVARIFAELQNAQASAERIITLINTEPEITDLSNSKTSGEILGNVDFKKVGFYYKPYAPVLENFNLSVQAGETIALVGATGGGKTTIANLVARFYEPTSGKILIDGVDYKMMSQHFLQSNLGVVLQSPYLFGGSIKDNILYGNLDATNDEIIEAAKLAQAHDFIEKLGKGYDSDVGESGKNLSVGQKQLISLARAILANPAILIMDEATSSVDTETEQKIQKAIEELVSGRTSFIIAHRLSTIRNADRILVIEHGEIIEEGNHSNLLKQNGKYSQLYKKL